MYSMTVSAVGSWNKIQKQLNMLLKYLSPKKIKTIVSNFQTFAASKKNQSIYFSF